MRCHPSAALAIAALTLTGCISINSQRPPAAAPGFDAAAAPIDGTYANRPVHWGEVSLLGMLAPAYGSCIPGKSCEDQSPYDAVRLEVQGDFLQITAWAHSDSAADTLRKRVAIARRAEAPGVASTRMGPRPMVIPLFGLLIASDWGASQIGRDAEGRLLVHAQRKGWTTGFMIMPLFIWESSSVVGVFAPLSAAGSPGEALLPSLDP